jgi:hypothetical protein
MLSTIKLYPPIEVISGYFHGYNCVHKDTVHFDSTQTHHLLPLERGRLQSMYGVTSTTRPYNLQSSTCSLEASSKVSRTEFTVNLLFVRN